jgi:hypothetical protein
MFLTDVNEGGPTSPHVPIFSLTSNQPMNEAEMRAIKILSSSPFYGVNLSETIKDALKAFEYVHIPDDEDVPQTLFSL